MLTSRPWLRSVLAVLSVPLLAAPSAYGVFTYLEPLSGAWAAGSAALGYEVLYIGVNVLRLSTKELRAYGRNVALAGVATAVVFNTLAHYRTTVPDIAHTAVDVAALGLALLTSLPLAALAYAMSVLLHRLSDGGVRAHENGAVLSTLLQTAPAPHQETTVNVMVADSGSLSKTARVKRLAESNGWSISTAWRKVDRNPHLLEGVK